jgi:hypothetical protein
MKKTQPKLSISFLIYSNLRLFNVDNCLLWIVFFISLFFVSRTQIERFKAKVKASESTHEDK